MKRRGLKIEMIIERTRTGYSAYASEWPVFTTGRSLMELRLNMLHALNLYFRKEGISITDKNLKVVLDLPQFFEFYKVINAKALSARIGMNQSLLAQYISGHKKPSANQVLRILNGIQEVGRELMAVRLLL